LTFESQGSEATGPVRPFWIYFDTNTSGPARSGSFTWLDRRAGTLVGETVHGLPETKIYSPPSVIVFTFRRVVMVDLQNFSVHLSGAEAYATWRISRAGGAMNSGPTGLRILS
jgi:hypothetical protein